VDKCLSATAEKVNSVLSLLTVDVRVTSDDLRISGAQLGEGYGMPTRSMVEAVERLASSEGLLIDPVYGGKAFAGLLSDIESGTIEPQSTVLFIMTGGSPGLYAYADVLTGA
jgi:D-cysteine desulfhydrase